MKLFEPICIGKLGLKNRLVTGPMSINLSQDYFVTERMVKFYEERAKGGVGLITIGDGIVDVPIGNNVKESLGMDDDRYIPKLRNLTGAVKAHGVKIVMQLSHAGRRAGRVSKSTGRMEVTRGLIPVAPSSIPHPVPGYVVPIELTVEEIEEIVEKFGEAARRSVEAGFDGVGLHCAHMYLCGEFLSPWANRRTDKYGGSLEGRLRFVLEVIERMREKIGSNYPIICRMNGEEPEGGNTLEDIQKIAQKIEDAGVDAIHVSVGFGAPVKTRGFIPSVSPMRAPQGCIVHLAENIKKKVSIPVIAVNKIRDLDYAEKILQERKADLIGLGRPLIADPELPKKAAEGKLNDIIPCIYCQRCIQSVLEKDEPAWCTVNPKAGREGEYVITLAEKPKKILIVGGGPAGMEASITAADKGHDVYIVEKEMELGGQMLLAVIPPGKTDLQRLIDYMKIQVEKRSVKIKLGIDATSAVDEIKPDVVIVAAGGLPVIPEIPGIDGKNVVAADRVLRGEVEAGREVAIIGGGQAGIETAEYLAEKGKKVTVIEKLADVGGDMPSIDKLPLLLSLEDYGVEILTKTEPLEITEEGVLVNRKERSWTVKADTLVLAAGTRPNDKILSKLKDKFPELYVVGDCEKPGNIFDAIRGGFEAALKI